MKSFGEDKVYSLILQNEPPGGEYHTRGEDEISLRGHYAVRNKNR